MTISPKMHFKNKFQVVFGEDTKDFCQKVFYFKFIQPIFETYKKTRNMDGQLLFWVNEIKDTFDEDRRDIAIKFAKDCGFHHLLTKAQSNIATVKLHSSEIVVENDFDG